MPLLIYNMYKNKCLKKKLKTSSDLIIFLSVPLPSSSTFLFGPSLNILILYVYEYITLT